MGHVTARRSQPVNQFTNRYGNGSNHANRQTPDTMQHH
jgi:hypothetical protein